MADTVRCSVEKFYPQTIDPQMRPKPRYRPIRQRYIASPVALRWGCSLACGAG